MTSIPCQTCRRYDEHGDPQDYPYGRGPRSLEQEREWASRECAEPRCRDGWIELEECDGSHQEVEQVYEHEGEWLCGTCFDERTSEEPAPARPVETIDLVDFAARVCGMRR